ncbi:sodium/proton-translocating pyrophosphatase, partial [Planctomycetota bacterium]|nr:sodium/proton-translocating pyrophosphatase [Planctomycetota bacterium]
KAEESTPEEASEKAVEKVEEKSDDNSDGEKEKTKSEEAEKPKYLKYVKGTEEHKATVVGDTVGDPFKDTSGPSLNILIKLMSMVSVATVALIMAVNNGQGILSWIFDAIFKY